MTDRDKTDGAALPMDPSQRAVQWDRQWHDRWSKATPVGFEARLDTREHEGAHEFPRRRTPQGERDRMNRITQEFTRGFEQLYGLGPAIAVFGSARFPEGTAYYDLGVDLGRRLARAGFTVMTGGGPGLMEAANRGAREAGGPSIGCNIRLPHEPEPNPNPYLDKVVTFNHFFTSKVMLVKYSCGFVCLPGGFGTLDGLFEAAMLIRSGTIGPFPLVLLGRRFWSSLREFVFHLLDEGAIGRDDLGFAIITDSAAEAVDLILRGLPDDVKGLLKPPEHRE